VWRVVHCIKYMSKLTRKLWKVSDAVQIKQETTTEGVSMKDNLMKLLIDNKKVAIFVVIVLLMVVGSWLGL